MAIYSFIIFFICSFWFIQKIFTGQTKHISLCIGLNYSEISHQLNNLLSVMKHQEKVKIFGKVLLCFFKNKETTNHYAMYLKLI